MQHFTVIGVVTSILTEIDHLKMDGEVTLDDVLEVVDRTLKKSGMGAVRMNAADAMQLSNAIAEEIVSVSADGSATLSEVMEMARMIAQTTGMGDSVVWQE